MSDEAKPEPGIDPGRALGENGTFEIDGQVYHLAGLTYSVRERYAQFLRSQTVACLYGLLKEGLVVNIDRALADICNDWAAGHYRWGGKVARESFNDAYNKGAFIYFQLQKAHPKLDMKTVQGWMEKHEDLLYRLSMEAAFADPTTASSKAPEA